MPVVPSWKNLYYCLQSHKSTKLFQPWYYKKLLFTWKKNFPNFVFADTKYLIIRSVFNTIMQKFWIKIKVRKCSKLKMHTLTLHHPVIRRGKWFPVKSHKFHIKMTRHAINITKFNQFLKSIVIQPSLKKISRFIRKTRRSKSFTPLLTSAAKFCQHFEWSKQNWITLTSERLQVINAFWD